MYHAGLEHVKLQIHLYPMEIGFVGFLEIENVSLRLGHANADIEGVNLNDAVISFVTKQYLNYNLI